VSHKGLFITIEGGEGVGKSTNIQTLCDYLKQQQISFTLTREPGGTPLAEDIRSLLLAVRSEKLHATAELLLMFAARAQHLAEKIQPALMAGQWVVCDRFTDATFAYQSGGRGLEWKIIEQLQYIVQGQLQPDHTILLDAQVATGIQRARGRGDLDRFEREDLAFFQRVRDTYLRLAKQHNTRYAVVNAERSLVQVEADVIKLTQQWINHWREQPDSD